MAADKKSAPKKTVVKKSENTTSHQDQLAEKQQDLLEAKRSHAGGELVNPKVLHTIRKEIARLHTKIREAELKESK